MNGKPWYQSRTIWANIIAIVVGAIAGVAQEVHGGPVVDPGLQGTGGYVWDAKRTDAGQEAVLAYGNLNLKPNVAA